MPKADEPKSIGDLFPHLTPEQLAEAEQNLTDYVALAWRVWERLQSDPVAYEEMLRLMEERRKSKNPEK
jgi:hypothetical protein